MFWFFELTPIALALLAILCSYLERPQESALCGWASFAITQGGRLWGLPGRRRAAPAARD